MVTDGIDVLDPDLFVDGPPHEVFDLLRRETPVYWNPREDDPAGGLWVVTRYADVLEVTRDPERFTSTRGITAPRDPNAQALFVDNVMFRDPPDHTKHRRALNRSFTPKAMVDFEPGVRAIVLQLLDRLEGLDEFDWVPMMAAELPARVVAWLVGVPEEDHGKIVEWASITFNREGDSDSPERRERYEGAIMSMMGYSETLKAERRACPADDVMTLLVQSEVDGCPISEPALNMWFFTLVSAGFETTHTLIAQGVRLLSEQPAIRERLQRDPAAIPRSIEEMLRYITPVNMFARTAVTDTEVGGQAIRAGDYVSMWYCAANHDPEVFDRPHEFDMDRSPNAHLSFGGMGSPHFCLGAHLARLEMRVLLEELAARDFPYEVAGPAVRMPGTFVNALTTLPMARRS